MSLFHRSRDILPVHSNSPVQDDNFLNKTIKKSDKHILATIAVFTISVLSIVYGIYHCNNYGYHYTLSCDNLSCSYISYHNQIKTVETFNRSDIKDSDLIRIDNNGNILHNSKNRNSGYSVLLTYQTNNKILSTKALLISPKDMGRRLSKSSNNQINRYITGKANQVKFTTGQSVTLTGLMFTFLGFISICLLTIFGKWPNIFGKSNKRLKKAS